MTKKPRKCSDKLKAHLSTIASAGGQSRSDRKLDAVTSNLAKAMRARYPLGHPKWNPHPNAS